MRHQTCPDVLQLHSDPIGSARAMVKRWTPLRWVLVIGIIVSLGVFAVSAISGHFEAFVSEAPDSVSVLVVSQYVPPYTSVNARSLSIKNYPPDLVPPGAFHALKDIVQESGRPLFLSAVSLPVGLPLTRNLVTDVDKSHGLASILPMGKIAVSFSVDKVRSAGGWVKPGDTISIFNTMATLGDSRKLEQSTHLLFPAADVIAVNKGRLGEEPHVLSGILHDSDDVSDEDSVITVRMNPVEAAALVQARESGHLSVALRALGDEVPADAKTIPGTPHDD